jgi:FkbM family methyltransferase
MFSVKLALATARTRPNPLKYLLGRILVRSRLASRLFIRRSSYSLRFSPTSLAFTLWELGPSAWTEDEDIIRSVLRPGDTYVDVGANIGALALAAKTKVGTGGAVIAIEAHPKTFTYLQQNVDKMKLQVKTYNFAVGETHGKIRFTDTVSDDMNSVAVGNEGGITVVVRRLDDLLECVSHVRLLKVDVEGFELSVFRGAREVLARTDIVYFESFDRHSERYGYETGDLIRLLNSAGFSVYRANERQCLQEVHSSPTCENLIAVSERCGDRDNIMSAVSVARASRPRHHLMP